MIKSTSPPKVPNRKNVNSPFTCLSGIITQSKEWYSSADWHSCWVGLVSFVLILFTVFGVKYEPNIPENRAQNTTTVLSFLVPGVWTLNPTDGFVAWPGFLIMMFVSILLCSISGLVLFLEKVKNSRGGEREEVLPQTSLPSATIEPMDLVMDVPQIPPTSHADNTIEIAPEYPATTRITVHSTPFTEICEEYLVHKTKVPCLSPIAQFFLDYFVGSLFICILSVVSLFIGNYKPINGSGVESTLWAFIFGLVITNIVLPLWRLCLHVEPGLNYRKAVSIPLPVMIKCFCNGEWLLKVGLVLLGIDLQTLGSLGGPGILAAGIDTPLVLMASYAFGVKVLKMENRKLAMILAAGLSICGTSAAAAVIGVVDGSENDLAFVISLLTVFTSIQMIALPFIAKQVHLSNYIVGSWIGGSIDQTGSVIVAASIYGGQETETTAGLVKIIQNAALGFYAIGIAIYWLKFETNDDSADTSGEPTVSISTKSPKFSGAQIWAKFPKFVVGFFIISICLTIIRACAPFPQFMLVRDLVSSVSKWYFLLGFVCTGLETNVTNLFNLMGGIAMPIVMYLFGQSLDLLLGFGLSYLAFGVILTPA